jgi:predicted amidohydrolase YtcJ
MTEAPADMALVGGAVITMAGDQVAEAVAVRNGRVAAVGSSDEIRALIGPDTTTIELEGKAVVPGLIDCHTHVATDAKDSSSVELRDFYVEIPSVPELLTRLEHACRQSPEAAWIVGRGGPMQDSRLREGRFPTRSELDAAMGGHPGYLTFGSHVLIANTAAMRALGIDSSTTNPRHGQIVKDPATGEPTGEFRDGSGALFTLGKQMAAETLSDLLGAELLRCAERGVTCIHDVVASPNEIQAYQDLHDAGRLPVRVRLLVRVVHSDFPDDSVAGLAVRQGFGNDVLAFGGVKCSVDGGMTGRTAAFSTQLIGGDRGVLRISGRELEDVIRRHHRAGIRVCVHAIGDKALDITLETFGRVVGEHRDVRLRHRIEHMGNLMCTTERIGRAREAGLCAVPNPAMMHYLGDEMHAALGPDRWRDAFPFRSIRDAGLPMGFGSDGPGLWPSDPLRDVGTAMSRETRTGSTVSAEQALSFREALEATTTNAAWIGYDEARLGSLVPGKLADMVILGPDKRDVETTIVGGAVVHQLGR